MQAILMLLTLMDFTIIMPNMVSIVVYTIIIENLRFHQLLLKQSVTFCQ